MNIFELYLDKIKKIIIDCKKNNYLKAPFNLDSINIDIPPEHFDSDISTNVAMLIAKINNKDPLDVAKQLIELIKKDDVNIASIDTVKPGFINIKFKQTFWNEFLKDIIDNESIYGSLKQKTKISCGICFCKSNRTASRRAL